MFPATSDAQPFGDSRRPRDATPPRTGERIPWWVAGVVILGAALTLAGAVISKAAPTLVTDGSAVTGTARVYADYVFARDLPLALLLLALLALGARRMLAGLMVLTGLIQLVDVANDLLRGDFVLVPGLLVFALLFLLGARKLFGQAIWRADAWRDAPPATASPDERTIAR
jgi:hypothetical protein